MNMFTVVLDMLCNSNFWIYLRASGVWGER